jgi:hypothetical protein
MFSLQRTGTHLVIIKYSLIVGWLLNGLEWRLTRLHLVCACTAYAPISNLLIVLHAKNNSLRAEIFALDSAPKPPHKHL